MYQCIIEFLSHTTYVILSIKKRVCDDDVIFLNSVSQLFCYIPTNKLKICYNSDLHHENVQKEVIL